MQQIKWFQRNFNFDFAQNIFPSIIERLAGTPVRLEEKFKFIPPAILSVKINGAWSIKENVGHLIDLEPLWQGRLEDILNDKTELRPTDLQNIKTSEANHNAVAIEKLLSDFRQIRNQTINLIENLTEKQIFKSAPSPAIKSTYAYNGFIFICCRT